MYARLSGVRVPATEMRPGLGVLTILSTSFFNTLSVDECVLFSLTRLTSY